MSAMNTLKKFGLEQAFNYVYKDRRARQYFEQLPDYVQQQIRSRESNIHSFENLKDYAENLLRGDC